MGGTPARADAELDRETRGRELIAQTRRLHKVDDGPGIRRIRHQSADFTLGFASLMVTAGKGVPRDLEHTNKDNPSPTGVQEETGKGNIAKVVFIFWMPHRMDFGLFHPGQRPR